MNDLSTAIPPDTAWCGSFVIDSQGGFLYSQFLKKRLLITLSHPKVHSAISDQLELEFPFMENYTDYLILNKVLLMYRLILQLFLRFGNILLYVYYFPGIIGILFKRCRKSHNQFSAIR
jgi:hypothetical protein